MERSTTAAKRETLWEKIRGHGLTRETFDAAMDKAQELAFLLMDWRTWL